MGTGDWHFSWHAHKKALYPTDHLSECIMNAHSCLCMLPLPVCLRPDQPCHGETGGAPGICSTLSTSPQCLVTAKCRQSLVTAEPCQSQKWRSEWQ